MNNYIIEGVKGFDDKTFYKAMKAKYTLFPVFLRENPNFPSELEENLREVWEDIEELTLQEMFLQENAEKRAILFHCYGPEKLFKSFKSKLIDKQTLRKNNIKIEGNKEISYTFEDTYSLYQITDKKFLEAINEGKQTWSKQDVYMVHCKCTSTNKDYYIYVPSNIGIKKDAIEAIAWTFAVPTSIDNINYICRHGDVLILDVKDPFNINPSWSPLQHLNKEQYSSLLKIES